MRVVAELSSNAIVQVCRSLSSGEYTNINGKYVVDVPFGTLPVSTSSYMVPVDGGDITSLSCQALQEFYGFPHVLFNALLSSSDVSSLDFTATVDNSLHQVLPFPYTGILAPRAQTGRAVPPSGLTPLSTAILASNSSAIPHRPGCLITDTIDLTVLTGGLGATDFMVYWKIYHMSVSEDIMSTFGTLAGTNTPVNKQLLEIDPSTPSFVVAISTDDGISYTPVSYLQTHSAALASNSIRLAFLNTAPTKVYLATYAILF